MLHDLDRYGRCLLDKDIKKHVHPKSYRHLWAKIVARSYVKDITRKFEATCDACFVRPAALCNEQKRKDFPAWLYRHQRWPRAEEGELQQVLPSAVEIKAASPSEASHV